MRGAEDGQIEAACTEHYHLPDDRELDPSFEGRPDPLGVAGAQRIAQQPVVEGVLNRERDQEGDQAEAKVGAVAQRAP